ncbi:MAG TPA: VIT domain-containing protein [Verrucomicrobiota bacterium]|nr:VIT domain-containing protein [Verrucomicrobiota bacterium]HNU51726.1 VIT domain-containing protein [Verrucomicrobiota bacterium]
MIAWTQGAREELERYFDRIRPSLAASGADPAEVTDDLRRHLEREAAAAGLRVVTADDLRRLLQRIGAPEPPPDSPSPPPATPATPAPGSANPKTPQATPPSVGWWFPGVILPLATLLIEWSTGMCAAEFFDPIPTLWHILLVGLVPAANALVLLRLDRTAPGSLRWLAWSNGIAIGVSLFYAIRYIPLLLPGVFGLIAMGIGLLPWAPMLAFITALSLRRHLQRRAGDLRCAAWPGFALALMALLIIDSRGWITRWALQQAAAEDAPSRQRGLRWLRAVGDEQVMLRDCYGRTPRAQSMDLVTWLLASQRPVWPEQARQIYYRVTGNPFNAVPAPPVRTARGRWSGLDDWTWDTDQGGERVGGRIKGLQLLSSRLDAVIEPGPALAYTEWTLEFKNDSARQREARAQIQLPPGGVVSRLTLWVNGEPREAAFSTRSAVRQAYQQIAIQQRRDPVLVTTCGPDRVLVQCFPIPAEGGTMRIRLGITSPLLLDSMTDALFQWPCFVERNFTVPPELRHTAWAESTSPIAAHGESPPPGAHPSPQNTVRALLSETDLASPSSLIRVPRPAGTASAWARNPRDPEHPVLHQTLLLKPATKPSRIALVIDGSAGMAPRREELAAWIHSLPPGLELAALVAGDAVVEMASPFATSDPDARSRLAAAIRDYDFHGGNDNLAGLVQGWHRAAEKPDALVLWIHAPQPVQLGSVDAIRQVFDRSSEGPMILACAVTQGPNRVFEQLERYPELQAVPRLGSLREDLDRLARAWTASSPSPTRHFTPGKAPDTAGSSNSVEGSLHLVRLWAAEEIGRLHRARHLNEAMALATRYQLVTPLSGAVVLETDAQYHQTGLTPADPDTVPSIPEPGTWALFLMGCAALWRMRRHTAPPRRCPDDGTLRT